MNLDRAYHGRVTLVGKKIKLGHARLPILIQRFAEEFKAARFTGAKITGVFEFSSDPLPDAGLLDRETQLMHEMGALFADDLEEVFPGVTASRVADVMQSDQFNNYAQLAGYPEKRIGVDSQFIEDMRIRYEIAYPDCAPHFPRWVDS